MAITRGKHAVWVVGHAATLAKGSTTWSALLAHARAHGYHTAAAQVPHLLQTATAAASLAPQQLQGFFSGSLWQVKLTERFLREFTQAGDATRQSVLRFLNSLAQGGSSWHRRSTINPKEALSAASAAASRGGGDGSGGRGTTPAGMAGRFGKGSSNSSSSVSDIEHVVRVGGAYLVWHVDVDRGTCKQVGTADVSRPRS